MMQEQVYERIDEAWLKVIDCLDSALDIAIENADYMAAINFARAIEQCYRATIGFTPDFKGIEL